VSPDIEDLSKSYSKRIHKKAFEKALSKCGTHISRIIYKRRDELLYESFCCNITLHLLPYISTYCFNVTSLDLTAAQPSRSDIIRLSHCKKIKQLSLKLINPQFENELTMLFEENKDLEDIALYGDRLCPSVMKLPEHKMKAITLECNVNHVVHFDDRIFSSVSII